LLPDVGLLDSLRLDYTLMTFIIKDLTFKITNIIIPVFGLAKLGETHTPDPCEPS
jgi:hypothetical protein